MNVAYYISEVGGTGTVSPPLKRRKMIKMIPKNVSASIAVDACSLVLIRPKEHLINNVVTTPVLAEDCVL